MLLQMHIQLDQELNKDIPAYLSYKMSLQYKMSVAQTEHLVEPVSSLPFTSSAGLWHFKNIRWSWIIGISQDEHFITW